MRQTPTKAIGDNMKMLLLTAIFLFAFAAVLAAQNTPTVAEAEQFMNKAEAQLAELSVKVNQANWVHDNFISDDTEALAASTNDENTAVTTDLVEQAKRFHGLQILILPIARLGPVFVNSNVSE